MRITLGVTGGVAAYKAAELVRRLQQDGFSVQVVMTRGAREFVTPLTFAALSGQKVITDLFEEFRLEKPISKARLNISPLPSAPIFCLSLRPPRTFSLSSRAASRTIFLPRSIWRRTAPVVVAPAMNVNMWNHAATQENVEMLRARGVKIVDPDEGYLACGMTGAGRLAGQEEIVGGRAGNAAPPAAISKARPSRHRRAHLRRPRSRAVFDEPLVRQNGLRGRRSCSAT